jgi:hypothetical protein
MKTFIHLLAKEIAFFNSNLPGEEGVYNERFG